MSLLKLAGLGETPANTDWDPTDMGAILWLRGDLGLTESAGAVSAWANQGSGGSSGDFADDTFGTATYAATDADFNSQPTIDLSTGSLTATGGSWWDHSSEAEDMTWIFVIHWDDLENTSDLDLFTIGGTNPAVFSFDGKTIKFKANISGNEVELTSDMEQKPGTTAVVSIQYTGAASTSDDTLQVHFNNYPAPEATADLDTAITYSSTTDTETLQMGISAGGTPCRVAEVIMFHGLLSTGTNDSDLTSYLNTRYALGLSGVATGGWAPFSTSPNLWIRADLGHAYSDAAAVAAIANQAFEGTGYDGDADLAQAVGARQPTYDASHASFNSQAVLDFDGGDTLLSLATTWWEFNDGGDCTMVFIHRNTTATGNLSLMRTFSFASRGGLAVIHNTASNGRVAVDDGTTELSSNVSGGTQNATEAYALVYTGAVTTGNDSLQGWLDGSGSTADTGDQGNIWASTASEMVIGGTSDAGGQYVGQIAEIIYWKRALTAGEDSDLTSYINTRYGTSFPGITQ